MKIKNACNRPQHTVTKMVTMVVGLLWILIIPGCSSTEGVPDGDQLYTGLSKIKYNVDQKDDHYLATQEEIEAALAATPNGALLGSSYYRSPIQLRLWIWNTFANDSTVFAKWMTKTFGRPPVLISRINPELRASVARSLLRNHGYFRGNVDYEIITKKNPKEARIGYTVDMGPLFTIDSLQYVNFPATTDSLLDNTRHEALIHKGSPFDVATMDAERQRLATLFRNNGYYYYQAGYASYIADTLQADTKAQVLLKLSDNMPDVAKKKWYVGNINIQLRKYLFEELKDTFRRRSFTVYFNGKRSPLRPRVILSNVKMRKGQLYNYSLHQEALEKLNSLGLFQAVDVNFTPRDSSQQCDTLDMTMSCLMDKRYDFYVETNFNGKTNGRMGPGLTVGLTKRNAFRGGEKLDIKLFGSYEWQTGHQSGSTTGGLNSYDYGASASLEYPRLLLPFKWRHRFYTQPSTLLQVSSSVVNRAGFFKRHVVSGELTYHFQTSANSLHQFSPLHLTYNYMTSRTDAFDEVLRDNAYLKVTMNDVFIPKMRYVYLYNTKPGFRHPFMWQIGLSEAGNVLSLGYLLTGHQWNDRDKTLFKNPYAQYLKVETELRKTWQVSEHAQLVGHLEGGVIWSYGNALSAPYSEQFYVGGANSIRAFAVRSIGPGAFAPTSTSNAYLDQTGDILFQANLEYRPRLFGNLYGAVFLDAGNVWAMRDDNVRKDAQFSWKNFYKQIALGTGIGVRYDLDFFVIRIDWGIGLHVPYKEGFYNVGKFKNSQSINFAIGYPF